MSQEISNKNVGRLRHATIRLENDEIIIKKNPRYARELRITIYDMARHYSRVPHFKVNYYCEEDRALGLEISGHQFTPSTMFRHFDHRRYADRLEEFGWEVLRMEPRTDLISEKYPLIEDRPYMWYVVRKLEDVDVGW